MRPLRALFLGLLRFSGLVHLWRFLHRRHVVILMLHGVMDPGGGASWMPLRPRLASERLASYLRALSRSYRFVSLTEAADMLAGRRPLTPYSIALTYDDGYRNNVTRALPVMRRFGIPMTIFLPTGKIEERALFAFDRLDFALQQIPADEIPVAAGSVRRTLPARPRDALVTAFAELRAALKAKLGSHLELSDEVEGLVRACERRAGRTLEAAKESDEWSALLDWPEVERLAGDPGVELGSHTVDHVRLNHADAATIREQLRRSKEAIEERTGRPCTLLSYPDGSYDARVAAIASDAGYACAVTTDEGLNAAGGDPMALRRIAIPIDASETELLACVSGLSDALSRLKARLVAPRRAGP